MYWCKSASYVCVCYRLIQDTDFGAVVLYTVLVYYCGAYCDHSAILYIQMNYGIFFYHAIYRGLLIRISAKCLYFYELVKRLTAVLVYIPRYKTSLVSNMDSVQNGRPQNVYLKSVW